MSNFKDEARSRWQREPTTEVCEVCGREKLVVDQGKEGRANALKCPNLDADWHEDLAGLRWQLRFTSDEPTAVFIWKRIDEIREQQAPM